MDGSARGVADNTLQVTARTDRLRGEKWLDTLPEENRTIVDQGGCPNEQLAEVGTLEVMGCQRSS